MNHYQEEDKDKSRLRIVAGKLVDITFKATILAICTFSIFGAQIITRYKE